MERRDKLPYVISGVLLFLVGLVIAYVVLRGRGVEFPLRRFLVTGGILLLGVGFVIFVGYWVINAFLGRREKDVSVKEYVSSTRAIEIWKEEFIKDNGVPHMIPLWSDKGKLVLLSEGDVEVRDVIGFSDPSGQTSDRFLGFEVVVRDGRNVGLLVACVPIDLGEDFIRDNWNIRLRWNRSFNRFALENRKFPLTSGKSYAERLGMKRVELAEEGYSERQIQEMLSPFQESQSGGNVTVVQPEVRKPIQSPDVKDVFPEYVDQEEEVEVEDIQEDIERFRRENK